MQMFCRVLDVVQGFHVLQVLWPQTLTLVVMVGSVALTLEEAVSGNRFMASILTSQVVLNVVNATIVGGVYELASWLPPVYLQVRFQMSREGTSLWSDLQALRSQLSSEGEGLRQRCSTVFLDLACLAFRDILG